MSSVHASPREAAPIRARAPWALAGFLAALLVLGGVCPGEPLRISGSNPWELLGHAVAPAGDVDGDGYGDFIVGAYAFDGLNGRNAGRIWVVSGADGSALFVREGDAPGDWFGWAVGSAGDVDHDGHDEFLVGAPRSDGPGGGNAGRVYLFSGATGVILLTVDGDAPGDRLGEALAGAGDVDLDGVDDFLAGAPLHDGPAGADAGRVLLLSGADASVIATFDGEGAGDRLGTSVAGGDDVDGDLIPDLLLGAPWHAGPAGAKAGRVQAVSGLDFSVIHTLDGEAAGDAFGDALALAGDLDGDARSEILIGAPAHDAAAGANAGRAYLFRGLDASLLVAMDGDAAGDELGLAVAAPGDVDGDGVGDLLLGAPRHDGAAGEHCGLAVLRSGVDGSILRVVEGEGAGDRLGTSVAGFGDSDRDGRADFVVGAPCHDADSDRNVGQTAVVASTLLSCLRGSVNEAGPGLLASVLLMDGSPGDIDRRVFVAEGDPLTGSMELPPGGGNGHYAVHANFGDPATGGSPPLPASIGTPCFELILTRGGTPDAVWNGIGRPSLLGSSVYFDGQSTPDPPPAPSVFLFLASGDPTFLPAGTEITFQGIVVDPDSSSSKGASVTNAVILLVQ